MARPAPFQSMVGRDPQVARMVGVSAVLHGAVLFLLLVVLPLVKPGPLPIVAYTVELTDPNALGGRLAPGRTDLPPGPRPGAGPSAEAPARQGEPAAPAAKPEPLAPKPEAIAKAEPPPEPPPPPKPVERAPAPAPEPPKPAEPEAKLPSIERPPPPKPEAKKPPEPKPEPQPKPEAKKPEPPKPEAKKPEPPKAEPKPEAKPEPPKAETKPDAKPATATKVADAKPDAKPADAKPADGKPAGKPTGKPDGADDGAADAYASAAQKWRARGATGGGGGLGGTDTAPGPLGTPGYGAGGGQVVGFEFLAYQQRVVSTVKGVWTNAVPRPGLVAKVRFSIAPNGEVSGIRIEQPSGDGAFDGSALRAVQRANPLPPPPSRYVNEFRDFIIEFHSEEGGQAAG